MEPMRAQTIQCYQQTKQREHMKILQRQHIIEERKEMLENQNLEREESIRRAQVCCTSFVVGMDFLVLLLQRFLVLFSSSVFHLYNVFIFPLSLFVFVCFWWWFTVLSVFVGRTVEKTKGGRAATSRTRSQSTWESSTGGTAETDSY